MSARKMVLDGVFFQMGRRGAGRVWEALLEEWAGTPFGDQLVVVDRGKTAKRIPGIQYRDLQRFDYNDTSADRALLQQLCEQEKAALFMSTYFSTALTTPSVFLVHDMIPEALRADLNAHEWREKHHCIRHACAFVAVSHNTARDLVRFFPFIPLSSVRVAYNGVRAPFGVTSQTDGELFKKKFNLEKPYYLIVGERKQYKNAALFFKAFAQLSDAAAVEVVCIGGAKALEEEFKPFVKHSRVHMLTLSDMDLAAAYAGAIALVYPSLYEGFGLCVLEAMSCGCPVITCSNSALPEVAGEAALYVHETDVEQLTEALIRIRKPEVAQPLIQSGLKRYKQFTWKSLADAIPQVCHDALGRFSLERCNADGFLMDVQAAAHDLIENPASDLAQRNIRSLRRELAQMWLTLDPERVEQTFSGCAGKALQLLIDSNANRVTPDERDQTQMDLLQIRLYLGYDTPAATQTLLALLLYRQPWEIGLQFRRVPIPAGIAAQFVDWCSRSPKIYASPGEVQLHAQHVTNWLTTTRDLAHTRGLAANVLEKVDLTTYWLSGARPASTLRTRALLIERVLSAGGHQLSHTCVPSGQEKTRLGILHDRFGAGDAAHRLLAVLENLDRTQVVVQLYLLDPDSSPLTARAIACVSKHVRLPAITSEQAELIRRDELDVLLIGGAERFRTSALELLAAHRLAPVQIAFDSNSPLRALTHVDYYLAEEATAADSPDPRSIRLSGSGRCYSRSAFPAEETQGHSREGLDLSPQTCVFYSGARAALITPETFEAWAAILANVRDSALILTPFTSDQTHSPGARLQLHAWDQILLKYGIADARLLILALPENEAQFQHNLGLADVYLDAPPANHGYEIVAALTQGVPVITLQLQDAMGSVASAILREASLSEGVSASWQEYIHLATSWGTDRNLRSSLQRRICAAMDKPPHFLCAKACAVELLGRLKAAAQRRASAQDFPTAT